METTAYLEYFQLETRPFNLTPDPDFYCELTSSYEAFETLKYAIKSGSAISLLEGEIGTGKTFLCRRLLDYLSEDTQEFYFCYIPNPQYTQNEALRHAIANELGIDEETALKDKGDIFTAINHRLLELANQGKTILVIIDEAQNLTVENLEFVRLLTNLETESKKLVQVILFAQTEIQQQLRKPALRQLRQRIACHYKLSPMPKSSLGKYIAKRLVSAKHPTGVLFTKSAIKHLHGITKGVPRLVNILADKAMMASFVREGSVINKKDIKVAEKNSGIALSSSLGAMKKRYTMTDWIIIGSVVGLVIFAAIFILFEMGILL